MCERYAHNSRPPKGDQLDLIIIPLGKQTGDFAFALMFLLHEESTYFEVGCPGFELLVRKVVRIGPQSNFPHYTVWYQYSSGVREFEPRFLGLAEQQVDALKLDEGEAQIVERLVTG